LEGIQLLKNLKKYKIRQVKFYQEHNSKGLFQKQKILEIEIFRMNMPLGDGNKLKKLMKKIGIKNKIMPLNNNMKRISSIKQKK